MSAFDSCACSGCRSLALPSGSVRRWSELSERSSGAVPGTGQDKDRNTLRRGLCNKKGSGFRQPCTSYLTGFKNAVQLAVIGNGEAADASKNRLTRLAWNSITCMLEGYDTLGYVINRHLSSCY